MSNIPEYNPRLARKIQIIDIIITLAIVGVSILSILNYQEIKQGIALSIQAYGLAAMFLIILFMELVPQFVNPVVALWAGTLSGFHISLSIAVSIIASSAGSILGFELGRKYGFKYVCLLFKRETYEKVEAFWSRYGRAFVFISALTPVPYIPMIFGALEMSWRDFLIYGLIPRMFNFIIFGYLFYYGFWNFL
jgi:uncharacterized membrane protein YdjX (TVP38/TMEM64 family)